MRGQVSGEGVGGVGDEVGDDLAELVRGDGDGDAGLVAALDLDAVGRSKR